MNLLINYMKSPSAVLYKCQNIIKMVRVLEKKYSVSFLKTLSLHYFITDVACLYTLSSVYIQR